eukprot:755744-Hanusia_phi.AAC.3
MRGRVRSVRADRVTAVRKMVAELQSIVGCKTRPGLHPNVVRRALRRVGGDVSISLLLSSSLSSLKQLSTG